MLFGYQIAASILLFLDDRGFVQLKIGDSMGATGL